MLIAYLGTLLPHQISGKEFIESVEESEYQGGIFADDMRMNKTGTFKNSNENVNVC